ncbi:hypothetical protein [Amycolatopsis sp. H20-H5]|uniref:hypothetical protein n=1 Tax=Amycolatopsis sp. H20-H5 TaxID=3046309 RepID=UPI002DBAA674|nr:hypothetical protein [Amycolatopsis sp. H20-H5]MEC3979355.1 hypothetical protein [Amycolatopsis sp. H20-H5]
MHDGDHLRAADLEGQPDLIGPLSTFLHTVVEHRYAEESRFAAEFMEWPEHWRDKVTFDSAPLSLTPEETGALNVEVRAIVDRYRRKAREGDTPVRIHWAAFPRQSRPELP